jgi:uncharacterized protein involved in exopolysaccharide biosynthesis
MDRRNFPGLPLKPFVLPPLQPRYSAEPPEWTQSAPASDELAGFWQTLRYRKSTIVAVVLAFFAAAVIYTRWQTPMYQASVDLELQEPEGEFSALRTDSSNGFTNATSEAAIQTHVALLRSDPVAKIRA